LEWSAAPSQTAKSSTTITQTFHDVGVPHRFSESIKQPNIAGLDFTMTIQDKRVLGIWRLEFLWNLDLGAWSF
jgi:hypothetical protein